MESGPSKRPSDYSGTALTQKNNLRLVRSLSPTWRIEGRTYRNSIITETLNFQELYPPKFLPLARTLSSPKDVSKGAQYLNILTS